MPVSDIAVKAKTGRTWAQWCTLLDKEKAGEKSHKEISALLESKYEVGEWWCQMVTVGYERSRGKRAVNQTTRGFSASVSRTIASSAAKAHKAWTDDEIRAGKSLRITWPDETNVDVTITPRGKDKCVLAVQHDKLKSAAAVRGAKSFWSQRLDTLRDTLER
jgi:hypothetical protein